MLSSSIFCLLLAVLLVSQCASFSAIVRLKSARALVSSQLSAAQQSICRRTVMLEHRGGDTTTIEPAPTSDRKVLARTNYVNRVKKLMSLAAVVVISLVISLVKIESKWPKTWVKVIAASGWVIAAIGFFGNYSGLKVFSNDVVAKLAFEIDKNAVYVPLTSSETFVPRDDLENRVNNALTRQESQRCYHVLFGPKGVGKSAIVDKCAKGRRGVIKVVVTDSNTKKDVVDSVLRQLGYPSSDTNIDSEMLLKAVQLCKHKPILIFDIERGGGATVNSDAIQAVRSMAKVCAATCVCVIILSEASAVVEFGKDRYREEFLYVDEMTHEEGKQLLRSRGASFSERQLDYIFHNIGTSPAMLEKLVCKVLLDVTLEQFVEEWMREARKDLREFSHQPILDALKKHPDGVNVDAFLGVQDDGAKLWKPREVARAMVDSNAIVYRMETDQYQLMSTAHRTALLKTFKPLAKE